MYVSYKGIDTTIGDEAMATDRHGKESTVLKTTKRGFYSTVWQMTFRRTEPRARPFSYMYRSYNLQFVEEPSLSANAARPESGRIARRTTEALSTTHRRYAYLHWRF